MARRIDVELTSKRDDGTWTWRAAGAKQPKGVVDAALLYEGAKVGDIVRAEADFEIEGITITMVMPPKEKKRSEPERIEVLGTVRPLSGVTSSLVAKSDRPRRDRDRDRDRGPRREGDRPGGERAAGGERRREGGPSRSREGAESTGDRGERGPRPDRVDRPRGGRPEGGGRPDRPERGERRDRPERAPRPERPGRTERPAPPKPKRLSPGNVHRAAALEAMSPEQRPIAEQVLKGGIPALRQAVEHQNAALREAGQPEVRPEPLVAMAEELLPRLKAADWRDRAEAAVKDADEISIRDLRSVVTGADAVARDDETRLLASTLREALDRRVDQQRQEWVGEITSCLDDGRLVRALRVSARAPDPTSRFPAELALRLSEAASAAMAPDAPNDRWATLLDAVAASPVRRSVKPVGLPAQASEPLLQAARQASGRVPALAPLLGIDMPPPPGPPRPPKPGSHPGARRPPRPAPPAPPAPADAPAPADVAAPADVETELPAVPADVVAAPSTLPPPGGDGPSTPEDVGNGAAPADADTELPVQE